MIAFLGDSLIARGRWNEHFPNLQIENYGIDGDTINGVKARAQFVLNKNPEKIVLLIGINEFSSFISVDEVFKKYLTLLKKLKQSNTEIIVVKLLYTQMNSYNKKVTEFNSLLETHLKENNYSYIDLNDELSSNEFLKDKYTTDGIHLNNKAYNIFSSSLKVYI